MLTDTEYFDFKKKERLLLHFGPYSLGTKSKKYYSPRRFKEEMFQDRIPLNSQLLTPQENNPLKIVLSLLRNFLRFHLNMVLPLELKTLHIKH